MGARRRHKYWQLAIMLVVAVVLALASERWLNDDVALSIGVLVTIYFGYRFWRMKQEKKEAG